MTLMSKSSQDDNIQVLKYFNTFGGVAFLVWALIYGFYFKSIAPAVICVLSAVFQFYCLYRLLKKLDYISMDFYAFIFVFSLSLTSISFGGFFSAGVQHLLLFPFFCFVLLDMKKAIFWSIIDIAVIVVFYYLKLHDNQYIYDITENVRSDLLNIAYISILFAIISFCIFLKVIHDRQLNLYFKSMQESSNLNSKSQLGKMAGQIAHEINNPLSIIQGHSMTTKRKMKKEKALTSTIEKYYDSLNRNVDRIRKVVSSLRNLSRDPLEDSISSVKLLDIVEDAMTICREKFRLEEIQFFLNDPDLLLSREVQTKRVVISQLLLILLDNSYDEIINWDEKRIEIHLSQDDDMIQIDVIDSGRGVRKGNKKKVFRAFFTTKKSHLFSGLGLAHGVELATLVKGDLTFLGNNPTRFRISFPNNICQKTSDSAELRIA